MNALAQAYWTQREHQDGAEKGAAQKRWFESLVRAAVDAVRTKAPHLTDRKALARFFSDPRETLKGHFGSDSNEQAWLAQRGFAAKLERIHDNWNCATEDERNKLLNAAEKRLSRARATEVVNLDLTSEYERKRLLNRLSKKSERGAVGT